MNESIKYGVEELGSLLGTNSSIRAAFEELVDVIKEMSIFLEEQNESSSSRFLRRSYH